jgi:hypothetical protein
MLVGYHKREHATNDSHSCAGGGSRGLRQSGNVVVWSDVLDRSTCDSELPFTWGGCGRGWRGVQCCSGFLEGAQLRQGVTVALWTNGLATFSRHGVGFGDSGTNPKRRWCRADRYLGM